MITADGGGSNGTRVRLRKLELQKLAEDPDLPIIVCHLPPGTCKWNRIEHRLFSFITGNWRGKPLVCLTPSIARTIMPLPANSRRGKKKIQLRDCRP